MGSRVMKQSTGTYASVSTATSYDTNKISQVLSLTSHIPCCKHSVTLQFNP